MAHSHPETGKPEAPFGRQWLMGVGLLCLLLALACIDIVFVCLLMGRGSAATLLITQGAAALLVFLGLVLLRRGSKKPATQG